MLMNASLVTIHVTNMLSVITPWVVTIALVCQAMLETIRFVTITPSVHHTSTILVTMNTRFVRTNKINGSVLVNKVIVKVLKSVKISMNVLRITHVM